MHFILTKQELCNPAHGKYLQEGKIAYPKINFIEISKKVIPQKMEKILN